MKAKDYLEPAWVKDNLSALKQFKKAAGQLSEIWQRINKNTPLTTEHYHQWLKDPEHVYKTYRDNQISDGFPAALFDQLDEKIRRPSMFEPIDRTPQNPMGITRTKMDGSTGNIQPVRSGSSQRPGQSFDFIYSRAKKLSQISRSMARERGSNIVVSGDWITFKNGLPCIPEDAEKKIEKLVTIQLTPEMQRKAAQMEAAMELFNETDPKDLPLKRQGKGFRIDMKKIAKSV